MAEVNFSIWNLLVKNCNEGAYYIIPTFDGLETSKYTYYKEENKTFYKIDIKKIKKNNYIFFFIEYGSNMPREDYVINLKTKEEKLNPLDDDDAELLKQIFALYDFDSNLLYLNNIKNRSIFLEILEYILNEKFEIKGMYQEKSEFIKILNEIKEISFTSKNNIFSQNSIKRNSLENLSGVSSCNDFIIKIEYKKAYIENLKNHILSLFKEEENKSLNSLLIRGIDEEGFEHLYNIKTFIKKISIYLEKNNKGKYEESEIEKLLIKRIKELKYAKKR